LYRSGYTRQPNPSCLYAPGVVGLIVTVGHHQVRDSRLNPLRESAHSAVVHKRRTTAEHLAERHVGERAHARPQIARDLLRMARHQHASQSRQAARFNRFPKELRLLRRARPWGEENGSGPAGQKLLHFRRHRDPLAGLVQDKPCEVGLRGPIRLRACKPLWEKSKHQLWGVNVLRKNAAHGGQAELRPERVQRRPQNTIHY
jgi:hypothetical protein